jgi:hypothetical protein
MKFSSEGIDRFIEKGEELLTLLKNIFNKYVKNRFKFMSPILGIRKPILGKAS